MFKMMTHLTKAHRTKHVSSKIFIYHKKSITSPAIKLSLKSKQT